MAVSIRFTILLNVTPCSVVDRDKLLEVLGTSTSWLKKGAKGVHGMLVPTHKTTWHHNITTN